MMIHKFATVTWILVFLAVCCLTACGTSQTELPDTLDDFIEHLDARLPELLNQYRAPGAAVALVEDGAVAWAQGFGLVNVESATPMTAQTVFQVASISKSVTAWGVMRLVEAGELDLDAPIAQYLTRWQLPNSKYDQNGVTVRRLLSHTAGIAPWGYGGVPVDETPPTIEALLSDAYTGKPVQLNRQPGEVERYSNSGYILLQLLVEEVTGEPFAAYMQREVLAPLGMVHSRYQWDSSLSAVTAMGYQAPNRPVELRQYPEAPGGLFATVTDIAVWMASGMSGPNQESAGRDVLQPETVALMYTPVLGEEGNGLGYVMETLPDGTRIVLGSGEVLGWRGQYTALPDAGKGIVVLTNSSAGGRYVVARATCRWLEWAAGDVPNACRIYRAVDIIIPVIAGLVGLAAGAALWRLIAQIRTKQRMLTWPPQTGEQRRDFVLAFVMIALWWTFVAPRFNALLPPAFNWISLAITLWLLVRAARSVTTAAGAQPDGE